MNEYRNRLKGNRSFFSENHRHIVDYWITECKEKLVELDQNDGLMQSIKRVIPYHRGEKTMDRVFVYVAVKEDSVLVTNDRKDIIDEGNRVGERRRKILKIAKRKGYKHVKIWVSKEAYDVMIRSAGGKYELNENQVDWKYPAA